MQNACWPFVYLHDTQILLKTRFFVMPATAVTVLRRRSSEELGILKMGVFVDACELKDVTDKKAAPI